MEVVSACWPEMPVSFTGHKTRRPRLFGREQSKKRKGGINEEEIASWTSERTLRPLLIYAGATINRLGLLNLLSNMWLGVCKRA